MNEPTHTDKPKHPDLKKVNVSDLGTLLTAHDPLLDVVVQRARKCNRNFVYINFERRPEYIPQHPMYH